MIPGGILKCENVPSDLLFNVCVDPILQNSLCEPIHFQNLSFFPNNHHKKINLDNDKLLASFFKDLSHMGTN